MEAPRNYNNDSFFYINLFNFQDKEKLDDNFENEENNLLFNINSKYEEKSNSIKEYAKELISLTIKIGEKEILITSFNCAKLENVTKENLIEIENKIKYLPSAKQRHDLTKRIKCATKLLENAEEIPTIIIDKEEFHITCLGYGKYMNLTEEQLKILENQMKYLSHVKKKKIGLYAKLFNARMKDKQNQPKKISMIKIGEKEIPLTSFNCTKLENVTKENLIEIENKIKDLSTFKEKYDLTMRINCAKKLLENVEKKIPTIIVDTEEFHITCIGYGEYKNLSEEQLKIIETRMNHLPFAERNKLYKKLSFNRKKKESRNAQDKQNQSKKILTIKIGEKEIPITSFNCTKLENVTEKNLIEIENKIKDLPTRKQKYDLTMRIKCARQQLLEKAEKIPTIRIDAEEFHITCLGRGEYKNLSEEQVKIIRNQMRDIPYAKRSKLYGKLPKTRKEKESRNAQDKQNHSNDHFKNKSIQTQDSLLEKNREQEEKSKPIEQDANNGLVQIDNYISDFFHSNTSNFFDSDFENHPESFTSSMLALDSSHTMTFNKEQNDQENQQTEVSLNQINMENPLSPLKSNFENNAEIFDFSILELDNHIMTFKEQNDQENQQTENIPKKRKWWDAI